MAKEKENCVDLNVRYPLVGDRKACLNMGLCEGGAVFLGGVDASNFDEKISVLADITGSKLDSRAFSGDNHLLLGFDPRAANVALGVRSSVLEGMRWHDHLGLKDVRPGASAELTSKGEVAAFTDFYRHVDEQLGHRINKPFILGTTTPVAEKLYRDISEERTSTAETLAARLNQLGLMTRLQIIKALRYDLKRAWLDSVPKIAEGVVASLAAPPCRKLDDLVNRVPEKELELLGWAAGNRWNKPYQDGHKEVASRIADTALRGVFEGQGVHVCSGPSRTGKTVLNDRILFHVADRIRSLLGPNIQVDRVSGGHELLCVLTSHMRHHGKDPSPLILFADDICTPNFYWSYFFDLVVFGKNEGCGWYREHPRARLKIFGRERNVTADTVMSCSSIGDVERIILPLVLEAVEDIKNQGIPLTVIATANQVPKSFVSGGDVKVHNMGGNVWHKKKKALFPDA